MAISVETRNEMRRLFRAGFSSGIVSVVMNNNGTKDQAYEYMTGLMHEGDSELNAMADAVINGETIAGRDGITPFSAKD